MIRDNDTANGDNSVPSQIYAKDMTIRQRMAMEFVVVIVGMFGSQKDTYQGRQDTTVTRACDLAESLIQELNSREAQRRDQYGDTQEAAA
jgi:hypothetical protein